MVHISSGDPETYVYSSLKGLSMIFLKNSEMGPLLGQLVEEGSITAAEAATFLSVLCQISNLEVHDLNALQAEFRSKAEGSGDPMAKGPIDTSKLRE